MKTLILLAVILTHADFSQSGTFTDTILTTSNVNTSTFGKLGFYRVDVPIFAQPLGVSNVLINSSLYNLIIVATTTNKVYAFNADQVNSSPIWKTFLGTTRQIFPGKQLDLFTKITDVGVIGTPAIDSISGYIYVVAALPASWRLFKLSLVDGTINNFVDITGHVLGTGDSGDTVIGGQLQFNTAQEFQRPGLTIANGNVYIAFGSFEDLRPWHGWIFAYSTSNLSQVGVFCTTPNTWGGAIWQSGAAPSVDNSGNIYVTTGNGAGGISNGVELSESTLKLSPALSLLDYFTPSNYIVQDTGDLDVSSSGVILTPSSVKAIVAGKDFSVYTIDITCMGHLQGSNALCSLQTFKTFQTVPNSLTGSYNSIFANNTLYLPTTDGTISPFSWSGSTFSANSTLSAVYGFPGPVLSSSNGILWAVTGSVSSEFSSAFASLHAINTSNLVELWNSDQTVGDTLGHLAKFVSPLIFNGRVYVPNQDGQVQVYGLR